MPVLSSSSLSTAGTSRTANLYTSWPFMRSGAKPPTWALDAAEYIGVGVGLGEGEAAVAAAIGVHAKAQ